MLRLPLFLLFFFSCLQIQGQLRSLSDSEVEKYTQVIQENGDSAVQKAYALAIHYKRKGNESEKYKHYCLYIIEQTNDSPASYYHLRALRAIAIIYLQSSELDSMNYYTDKIIEATENVKNPEFLRFRGMAYNIKASEHLSITFDYDKAYPLLRKAMEVAESVEYASDYLNAAYYLCDLINSSEPHKIPETVEEIEKTVKIFKNQPEQKYVLRKVQQFKYNLWARDTTGPLENRAAALAFSRSLMSDFQKDRRMGDAMKEISHLVMNFEKELGKDSVLYYTEKAYEFHKNNDDHLARANMYFQYAKALYNKGFYSKSILIFKEVIPLCGTEKTVSADDRIEGNYTLLATTYHYLTSSYLKLNDLGAAQKYLEKYVKASENEKVQAVGNAVSDLETKYEVEKKEIENVALLSENNLIQTRFRLSSFIGLLLLSLLGASIFFFIKMRKSKEELERINEGKNQLFAIVAHDLKGPVSSFSNLSFNLSHLIKNKQYDDLQNIGEYYEKAGRKINYILVNLLDWAISQKDHFVHKPQQVDIKVEVNKIIEELSYSLGQKRIKVENQVSSDQSILFDKNAFKIIVRNLLHNAVKFSHQDSTVVIDYDSFGLKVKDSGIGMEPSTIQKIMKSQRVESINGTNAEKGNGIGLSTCLKLAEQNSAKLQIESKHGEGTVFTLIAD